MIWVIQQRKVIHYKNKLSSVIIKTKWLSKITPELKDTVQHFIISYHDVIDYTYLNDDIRSNVSNVNGYG